MTRAGSPAHHSMPALKVTSTRPKAARSHQAAALISQRQRMYSCTSSPEEPASSMEWDPPSCSHALQLPPKATSSHTGNSQPHDSAQLKERKRPDVRSPSRSQKGAIRNGFAWLRNLMYGRSNPRLASANRQLAPASAPRSLRSRKQIVTRSHRA